jgi:hypothetical protein
MVLSYGDLRHDLDIISRLNTWYYSEQPPDTIYAYSSTLYFQEPYTINTYNEEDNNFVMDFTYSNKYSITLGKSKSFNTAGYKSSYLYDLSTTGPGIGDLIAGNYEFKVESDSVFMIYKFEKIDEHTVLYFETWAYFPEKGMVIAFSGPEYDIYEAIDVLKAIVYDDPSIEFELLRNNEIDATL